MTKQAEATTLESVERGNVVDVVNLKMYFPVRRGLLKRKIAEVKALDDVSFSIRPGETLGLVGESGCGKTTVGRCLLRLYKPTKGVLLFEGTDISSASESSLRQIRRRMALVFQDPYSSLDPRMNSGDIVGEPLKIHRLVRTKKEYQERVAELFTMTGPLPGYDGPFPP